MPVKRKNSISIIIATKNRRFLLERALRSIEIQKEKPDEIIIINDGSTDNTEKFLNDNKAAFNLIVINRKESGGVNTVRNAGIRASTSEWIMFLDDDDELLPDSLSSLYLRIKDIPADSCISYLNNIICEDSREYIGGFQFDKNETCYEPSYEEIMSKFGLKGDNSPVFRRSLFNSGKYYFPENLNGFESVMIKKIAKDFPKVMYYSDLLKKVDLSSSFEHLSFTASKRNPSAYIEAHQEDILTHKEYYGKNKENLSRKYFEMSKLAFRAHRLDVFIRYLWLSLKTKL